VEKKKHTQGKEQREGIYRINGNSTGKLKGNGVAKPKTKEPVGIRSATLDARTLVLDF